MQTSSKKIVKYKKTSTDKGKNMEIKKTLIVTGTGLVANTGIIIRRH